MAPRRRRKKIANPVSLADALQAVLNGETPYVNGSDEFGIRYVADPHSEDREIRPKIERLDEIGKMGKRGQLGDGSLRDSRLAAAAAWQNDFEMTQIGQAKAMDHTIPFVDGGKFDGPSWAEKFKAKKRLDAVRMRLGLLKIQTVFHWEVRILGSRLLEWVLFEKLPLAKVANLLGYDRRHLPLLRHLLWCLDEMAIELGISGTPSRSATRRIDSLARVEVSNR